MRPGVDSFVLLSGADSVIGGLDLAAGSQGSLEPQACIWDGQIANETL